MEATTTRTQTGLPITTAVPVTLNIPHQVVKPPNPTAQANSLTCCSSSDDVDKVWLLGAVCGRINNNVVRYNFMYAVTSFIIKQILYEPNTTLVS